MEQITPRNLDTRASLPVVPSTEKKPFNYPKINFPTRDQMISNNQIKLKFEEQDMNEYRIRRKDFGEFGEKDFQLTKPPLYKWGKYDETQEEKRNEEIQNTEGSSVRLEFSEDGESRTIHSISKQNVNKLFHHFQKEDFDFPNQERSCTSGFHSNSEITMFSPVFASSCEIGSSCDESSFHIGSVQQNHPQLSNHLKENTIQKALTQKYRNLLKGVDTQRDGDETSRTNASQNLNEIEVQQISSSHQNIDDVDTVRHIQRYQASQEQLPFQNKELQPTFMNLVEDFGDANVENQHNILHPQITPKNKTAQEGITKEIGIKNQSIEFNEGSFGNVSQIQSELSCFPTNNDKNTEFTPSNHHSSTQGNNFPLSFENNKYRKQDPFAEFNTLFKTSEFRRNTRQTSTNKSKTTTKKQRYQKKFKRKKDYSVENKENCGFYSNCINKQVFLFILIIIVK